MTTSKKYLADIGVNNEPALEKLVEAGYAQFQDLKAIPPQIKQLQELGFNLLHANKILLNLVIYAPAEPKNDDSMEIFNEDLINNSIDSNSTLDMDVHGKSTSNDANSSLRISQAASESPAKEATPPKMEELVYWGVPQAVSDKYASYGHITQLYEWQVECLQLKGILQGGNLVYSAPTSGGKTLVAEVLIIRALLSKKKAIFVQPFVSVVTEKVKYMTNILESTMHVKIVGYYGSHGSRDDSHGDFDDHPDIAICTIEKANSLINKMIVENTIDSVGIIVIDEIHMVSDDGRGYLLELLLTKLLYHSHKIQIIGLSATLPNIEFFERWFHASVYITDYRPIPLVEYSFVKDTLYDRDGNAVKTYNDTPHHRDPDRLVTLCKEIVAEGHSVLVFCSTKRGCELAAQNVAILIADMEHKTPLKINALRAIVRKLKETPAGLDPRLEETIPYGVAYHHAGLTVEEREVIEWGFRIDAVKVLMATSTLAAGVNLPARRVIFRSPYIGSDFIDISRYKQMSGRAGRTGQGTYGDSIIMCKPNEKANVQLILKKNLPVLRSCFSCDLCGMTRPLLEAISCGMVSSIHDVQRYIRCTLFSAQHDQNVVTETIKAALAFLSENQLISWRKSKGQYEPTKLGKATVASALSPEEALVVFQHLTRARKNFAMNNELHLIYQLTPVFSGISPNWSRFMQIFLGLPIVAKEIAVLIGVEEGFLIRASSHGRMIQSAQVELHERFYAALILHDVIQETPFAQIEEKFQVSRGHIQGLLSTANTFSCMVNRFCKELLWWELDIMITHFRPRLSFATEMEILPLMGIPMVKPKQARVLYESGLQTIADVSEQDEVTIMDILKRSRPFDMRNVDESIAAYQEKLELRSARALLSGAREVISKQVKQLESDAENAKSLLNPASRANTNNNNTNAQQIAAPYSRQPMKQAKEALAESLPFSMWPERKKRKLGSIMPSPPIATKKKKASSQEINPTEVVHTNSPRERKKKDRMDVINNNTVEICVCHTQETLNECERILKSIAQFGWSLHTQKDIEIGKRRSKLLISGFSLCLSESIVYYIPLDVFEECCEIELSVRWDFFWSYVFANPFPQRKYVFNASAHIRMLMERFNGVLPYHEQIELFDVLTGFWMINPCDDMEPTSNEICTALSLKTPSSYSQGGNILSSNVPFVKCSTLSVQSFVMGKKLYKIILDKDVSDAFFLIEMPIILVAASMEYWGVGFDFSKQESIPALIEAKMNELNEACAKELKWEQFDINSLEDISTALFKILNLPVPEETPQTHKFPKSASERFASTGDSFFYRTNKKVLECIKHLHWMPEAILDYRSLKLVQERYSALKYYIKDDHMAVRCQPRIQCQWALTCSLSGRMISKKPNLQTVPHASTVRGLNFELRSCFCAAKGHKLLAADYSQLEVRLMAHFSQDPLLLSVLQGYGDIFSFMATHLFDKLPFGITRKDREQCKRVTYGTLYGIGPHSLGLEMKVPTEEAALFLTKFFTTFQGISTFIKNTKEFCKTNGYVNTISGRRNYFRDIYSSNLSKKAAAEREAVNAIIQGSASDLVKLAMIRIHRRMTQLQRQIHLAHTQANYEQQVCGDSDMVVEKPANYQQSSAKMDYFVEQNTARLVMQIHDELVYEVPEKHVHMVGRMIREEMENAMPFIAVPMVVNLRLGDTWASLTPFVT